MTSLMGAKRRAEEFAAALDAGAVEPDLAPELAELVELVEVLRTQEAPAPRADFSASLREQLVEEAARTKATDAVLALPPRRRGIRERRLALVASSLVIVGGSAGMAVAAQDALPGDALYPIKRGLERAQTDLATNDVSRGQDLLARADHRLSEVEGLIQGSGNLSQVPSTIDDFTQQALEGTDVLLGSFADERDPEVIVELRTFAADGLEALRELAETAPPEHQDELTDAALALLQIDERAMTACPGCAPELPRLKMPPLLLTASDVSEALDAMRRSEVNNDHPTLTDPRNPRPAEKDTQGAPEGDSGQDLQPPTGAGDEGGTPQLPGLPRQPDGQLGTDGGKGGKGGKGGTILDVPGDVAQEVLPDGLDPVLDTLLP